MAERCNHCSGPLLPMSNGAYVIPVVKCRDCGRIVPAGALKP